MTSSTDISLRNAQAEVDRWISGIGNGYFSPLTNMAVLSEEVGEVARIMARRYGDQKPKADDSDNLADELADVLWVTMAIANQTGIDLADAFRENINKKTVRDHGRFSNKN